MTDQPTTPNTSLRKKIIEFQKATIAEWENPTTNQAGMIKLAYAFADELSEAHKEYVPKHAGHEIDDQFCVACDEEIMSNDRLYTATELAQAVDVERQRIREQAEDVLLGCDGYEKERDSIKCQWCGETEYSSNHSKARLLAQLNPQKPGEGEV